MAKTKHIDVHGHRGSRGTHPENTIPAFEEAVKAGADVLELDLQLSKDDIPVVSHDPVIGEHCKDAEGKDVTSPIPIRTLTLAEIKKFDCGSRANPRFPEQKLIPGTKISSLEEFLKWAAKNAPKLEFNIETKMTAPSEGLVAPPELFTTKVVELLSKHGVIEKTILQSFDFRTLRVAKKLAPELRLSCLFEDEKNFCKPSLAEHAAFASPNWEKVTEAEVKLCQKQGIKLVPWTANTPEAWDKLIHLGVDAIITDYPRKLIQHMKTR